LNPKFSLRTRCCSGIQQVAVPPPSSTRHITTAPAPTLACFYLCARCCSNQEGGDLEDHEAQLNTGGAGEVAMRGKPDLEDLAQANKATTNALYTNLK